MGRFTSQLSRLQSDLKAVYDPATAMQSNEVREINHRILQLQEQMEGKEECGECNGWGETECDECGHDRECTNCDGSGLIEK